jgi:hypothetical protein
MNEKLPTRYVTCGILARRLAMDDCWARRCAWYGCKNIRPIFINQHSIHIISVCGVYVFLLERAAEMPANDKESHGIQLWVNLAAQDKLVPPTYQELPDSKVPRITVEGVTARVMAGEALGISSPVSVKREQTHLDHLH